jgi:hypothetical protein
MQIVRDLLDQLLRDAHGEPAGRADDFSIQTDDGRIYVESILTGGGIVADELGWPGRLCERLCRRVRRHELRRVSISWSAVSEVAEHALTVTETPAGDDRAGRPIGGIRLRRARRLPARTSDGIRLRLIDLQVVDPRPRERLRVAGVIVRRRHRLSWPVSLHPRQRDASSDWRYADVSHVRLTASELVIDRTYDELRPPRESSASHPPGRRRRSDPA